MLVISLVNGSMISETTAIYGLKYAQQLHLKHILIHIKGNDSLQKIEKSVQNITKLSHKYELETEFLILEDIEAMESFIEKKDVDMIFCSTRNKRTFFDKSFVKTLLKKELGVDMAVVKIVKVGDAQSIDKILLPIRASKLSVQKFTLFSVFTKAYQAKSEIYSLDVVSKSKLAKLNLATNTNRLKEVVFNFRHYMRLGKLMDFKFSIKHSYALKESDIVHTHLAKNGYDLSIIGAHRKKSFFSTHPINVLFEKPMVNTIYFIPKEDSYQNF